MATHTTQTLPNGVKKHFLNGLLHNDDGPAEMWPDGTQFWYKHGLAHRENGKPAVLLANGNQYWLVDGKRFRANDAAGNPLPNYIDIVSEHIRFNNSIYYEKLKPGDYEKYRYKYDAAKIKPAR
jgi:hypothetical protein